MSGAGGFYKYRCKYFTSHKCQNWVWVNGGTCQSCVADGRDDVEGIIVDSTEFVGIDSHDHFLAPRLRGSSLEYMGQNPQTPTSSTAPRPLGKQTTSRVPEDDD